MTDGRAADRLKELTERYGNLDGETLLAPFIQHEFHMAAEIDRGLPVVFIDTGKLFGETLRYRDKLVSQLGLTNLKVLRPAPADVAANDADGVLWHSDPDACCAMRKVAPLARALEDFDAWASGRKRFHGDLRAFLPVIEASGDKIKVNPLARWSKVRIEEAFAARDLPRHPLEADGFLSIGCMPCTERVAPAEDQRAGRWAGRGKTECGIHFL
jgi:phosphoadenosine phosphosulfate reductase